MGFPLWSRTLRLIVTKLSEANTFFGPHYTGQTVADVPKGEHLLVMMDANARTGRRGEGWVDDKMLRAYGGDTLNSNERRLLAFSTENQLALVNTFFRASKRGITYTFQSPNAGKDRCLPPGLYPHAANRQNMVRNVTVRRST